MKPREHAMEHLRQLGESFDEDVGNGLLVQLLADAHGIDFRSRPRKKRALEILADFMARGPQALKEAAGPPGQRNVYVIELDPRVLDDNRFRERNPGYKPGMACLYVGSTSRTPAERFSQHREGYKASRYPRKYGLRLRPDLYEIFNPMGIDEANEKEVSLARALRDQGYAVWQN